MEKDDCVIIQLIPKILEQNFRWIIVKPNFVTNSWVTSCEIAPDEYLDFINGLCGIDFIADKSTLVHVMSKCHQPASH